MNLLHEYQLLRRAKFMATLLEMNFLKVYRKQLFCKSSERPKQIILRRNP